MVKRIWNEKKTIMWDQSDFSIIVNFFFFLVGFGLDEWNTNIKTQILSNPNRIRIKSKSELNEMKIKKKQVKILWYGNFQSNFLPPLCVSFWKMWFRFAYEIKEINNNFPTSVDHKFFCWLWCKNNKCVVFVYSVANLMVSRNYFSHSIRRNNYFSHWFDNIMRKNRFFDFEKIFDFVS